MSNHTHKRPLKDSLSTARTTLAQVESEFADRYVEVEIEGISFVRFVCIYIAGARELRDRTLHGVRSLFRLNPAH